MAVLMSWASGATLIDRFETARSCLAALFPRRRLGRTYQGFIKNLLGRASALAARAAAGLRRRIEDSAGPAWRCEGWVALAADGSRFELPRTRALERAAGRSGKKGSGPQLHLTCLWHLGLGVPWSWVVQPAPGDERSALRSMLDGLPERALLVMDAGLTGYDLLRAIIASGRHFLLRVGSNVELLRGLGWAFSESDATVYLWPDQAARRGGEPLTLRLIQRGRGKRRVYLLTDLRDKNVLGDARAGRLYRRRWGVEVFYRCLKQVMQRRKLRSRTMARATAELGFLVIGAMLLGLLSARSLMAAGHPPPRASFAAALRAVRSAMARPGAAGLGRALSRCVRDAYRRRGPKAARAWPHKKKDPRPRPPRVRRATAGQIEAAQALRRKSVAA
jgi:hypothetical protein